MSFIDRELVSRSLLREDRRARLVRATLRLTNGTTIPVVVRNLSERGIGVTCKTTSPPQGEVVHVTLPGSSEMQGVVRWSGKGGFGIELSGPVDAKSIARTIQSEITRFHETTDWQVSTLHRVTAPRSNGPRRRV
ncbi:PilZ domain-containing protein [Novosphingobium acidiphilum]|uniref:PilZ domain-containing protein n=1 Tax=Novosphingobium acidiphilum TaxID=505248 RepID=UPI00040D84EE|nr:PilZ domain-containing protein [Novosphingobium acidiphilum]